MQILIDAFTIFSNKQSLLTSGLDVQTEDLFSGLLLTTKMTRSQIAHKLITMVKIVITRSLFYIQAWVAHPLDKVILGPLPFFLVSRPLFIFCLSSF